jgi:hypothetical protein
MPKPYCNAFLSLGIIEQSQRCKDRPASAMLIITSFRGFGPARRDEWVPAASLNHRGALGHLGRRTWGTWESYLRGTYLLWSVMASRENPSPMTTVQLDKPTQWGFQSGKYRSFTRQPCLSPLSSPNIKDATASQTATIAHLHRTCIQDHRLQPSHLTEIAHGAS